MKIGVIFTCWQAEDMVERSLAPWIAARKDQLGGHDYRICAVSVPFESFPQEGEIDATQAILGEYENHGDIDHRILSQTPLKETEARGRALQWLAAQGVEIVIQADGDEMPTAAEIESVFAFVAARPGVIWFRLCLRNAVFTEHQYLAEPFTPPRIHRIVSGGYRAHSFWDDNNVLYQSTKTPDHFKRDVDLPSAFVPKGVAWIRHLSWLSNARSRAKIVYQLEGRGWPECSFRWDDTSGLKFNEAYYARRGLPLPEVLTEP